MQEAREDKRSYQSEGKQHQYTGATKATGEHP